MHFSKVSMLFEPHCINICGNFKFRMCIFRKWLHAWFPFNNAALFGI